MGSGLRGAFLLWLYAAAVAGCSSSSGGPGAGAATGGDAGGQDGQGWVGGDAGPDAGQSGPDGGGSDSGPPACSADGFAASATSFALPTVPGALGSSGGPPLSGLDDFTSCNTNAPEARWSVVDMTGDGKPDFVLTAACSDASVGNTQWLVYASTGSGFAPGATPFALPTVPGAIGGSGGPPLSGLDDFTSCNTSAPEARWSVLDMTGDGKPDFVLTAACSDPSVGNTQWLVYPSTGSGFAPSATSFTLPTVPGALGSSGGPPLSGLDDFTSCNTSAPEARWSVLDMTGDGKPDFVLTAACSDPSVGNTQWLVYPSTGSGFAASATSFALPTVPGALGSSGGPPLSGLDDFTSCNTSAPEARWSVLDMTGDGKPDFVLTAACNDASVGNTQWLVYAGTGSGFAASATPFALPTVPGALGGSGGPPLSGLDDFTSCNTSAPEARWSVLDMTGDGKPDFVLTAACNDASVGNTQWLVYAGTGSGFAAGATPFALPTVPGALGGSGGPPLSGLDDFTSCNTSAPEARWSVLDMTGDGKPDFVLTAACSDPSVGMTHWSLYAGQCGH